MAKKKKKNIKAQTALHEDLLSGTQIPNLIQGASFDPSSDNPEEIENKILSGVNSNLGRKIKVMFISEASFLHTGFATYTREILNRLSKDDRFECSELGSYADTATGESKNLPWKFYGGRPHHSDQEGMKKWQSDKLMQFGAGNFEEAVLDFQPDVVLLHRDEWMDSWVVNNPYSDRFHTIWMACVDSYPQQWNWLKSYAKADTLLAYADYGKKVLEEQSRTKLAELNGIKPMNVEQVCRAGVHPEEFYPLNKAEVKAKYGISPKTKIIGSVMRNQPRKLFPTIIESFRDFVLETGDDDTLLLLHTGIPDVGFDIPEYVMRAGLGHKVLFSTICHKCDHNAVQPWGFMAQGKKCPSCGASDSVKTCSSAKGLENKRFNEIYNLMDLYVQANIAGADEMPATEAKAAGVPVACTEYAATYEKAHSPGGIPIKVSTFFHEGETKQTRAYICPKSLTKIMKDMMSSEIRRSAIGHAGRKLVEAHYDWDITADKWKGAILDAELKTVGWERPDVKIAIVGEDEASINLTKGNLPDGAAVEVVPSRDKISNGWTLILEEGDIFHAGNSNLKQEVFTHGHSTSHFMILNLEKLSNGTLNTNTHIAEPSLVNVGGPAGKQELIIATDQNAGGLIHHHTRLLKEEVDMQNDDALWSLRNITANCGEVIRMHINSKQPYIIRRQR